MIAEDNPRISSLDEKSDYALWRTHVQSAISSKNLTNTMSDMAEGTDHTVYAEYQQQARNIITAALDDTVLCVVQTFTGSPRHMTEKISKWYNSKSTTAKISKMSKLVSMRFENRSGDLSSHIDSIAGLTKNS